MQAVAKGRGRAPGGAKDQPERRAEIVHERHGTDVRHQQRGGVAADGVRAEAPIITVTAYCVD